MSTGQRTSVKGKIIAIFLVSLAAVISSYFVNKFAFKEIRRSVEDFSHTNKKLILVNGLFFEVNESEKSFRNMLTSDSSFRSFVLQSGKLRVYTDSLRILCADNYRQVALIDSITNLFSTRQEFLLEYVDFRRALRNKNPVLKQAKILDSLISIENAQVDSLVYSKESNQSTTKIDSVAFPEEAEKKGFWRKIFKPRKKETPKINQVTKQEVQTRIDTIVQVRRNRIAEEAQKIISAMGSEQSLRRKTFLNREIALNKFESTFQNKINDLLSEIERDITRQTGRTHDNAEKSIARSIDRVFVIIAVFFLLAVIIAWLMLADITKSNHYRKLLEIARKNAELRSLSWQRFLSNMSHEIRTPLQSIIGYSELMKKQEHPDRQHIDTIFSSSEHLLQVINEILDYNKIKSENFSFESIPFRIRELITETISILKYPAEQKGIHLNSNEQELPPDNFLGDPFRLKQILLNLLGNAIKFTNTGTVDLVISLRHEEDKCLFTFTVKDTGSGIPYDMQETIFDRFEQVGLPGEQKYAGSGLGLSIVKALVEGQGGAISLESEPGRGASFTFHIAYTKTTAPYKAPENTGTVAYDRAGPVWLIDDDNLILQLCSAIMEKHNITHRCFPDAASFLEAAAREDRPSCILMDIRMPGVNGFQLYDAARKRYADQVTIFAVTAQALPEERNAIISHGFDGILLKPFREAELLSLLSYRGGSIFTGYAETAGGNSTPKEEEIGSNLILQHYVIETGSDVSRLQAAVAAGDREEAAMMLHRIAGRTAQIGERELGRIFRKLEISVRNDQGINHSALKQAIGALEDFMQETGADTV